MSPADPILIEIVPDGLSIALSIASALISLAAAVASAIAAVAAARATRTAERAYREESTERQIAQASRVLSVWNGTGTHAEGVVAVFDVRNDSGVSIVDAEWTGFQDGREVGRQNLGDLRPGSYNLQQKLVPGAQSETGESWLEFTDVMGLRWRRRNADRPVRVV